MIGIYKITNKLSGKSYIGQSIHCGKRFDEHCEGNQFIDQVIQIEGKENFTFEILKETSQNELSLWEDYYIMKYNTMFPNGYNKKWNTSKNIRDTFLKDLFDNQDSVIESADDNDFPSNYIKFPADITFLQDINCADKLYTWLLLHSSYDRKKKYYYIYKENVVYSKIGQELHCARQTISKRFKALIGRGVLKECIHNDQESYRFQDWDDSELIDRETLQKLISFTEMTATDNLIIVYVYLLSCYNSNSEDFKTSLTKIIKNLHLAIGHSETYERVKNILSILREVGLLIYNVEDRTRNEQGRFTGGFHVYKVKDTANEEWLNEN